MQDNETLLAYLLQRGEESRALAVLRRPNISHELIYKFAPVCPLYIDLGSYIQLYDIQCVLHAHGNTAQVIG